MGVVHIGNIGRASLVREFYERCGMESGIRIGSITTFSTLEGLIDNMLAHDESEHVIVNHGKSDQGLLIPFTRETRYSSTGPVMDRLTSYADLIPQACLNLDHPEMKNTAAMMGVPPASVMRLAEKLVKLRKKHLAIEIRGCNIGVDPTMLASYVRAFGAARVTAPQCRMFYMRIKPHKPNQKKGETIERLAGEKPAGGRARRRMFAELAAASSDSSIIIDIQDIDGHTQVDSESFMNEPPHALEWAIKLNGAWKQSPTGTGNDQFVLPVMWDDNEPSYHCPRDAGYLGKLAVVR